MPKSDEIERRSPYDCEDVAVAIEKAGISGRWINIIGFVDNGRLVVHCTTNEFPTGEFSNFLALAKKNMMNCLQWDVDTKDTGSAEQIVAEQRRQDFARTAENVQVGDLPIKKK